MSGEVELARHWMAKALNDLLAADNNLAAAETPYDTVCFHCQQAAEKLLKAYLVAKGVSYPLTHDLIPLLKKIQPLRADVAQLGDVLALLDPYAVEIRYPGDNDMPEEQDARAARQAAEEVLIWLRRARPELFD